MQTLSSLLSPAAALALAESLLRIAILALLALLVTSLVKPAGIRLGLILAARARRHHRAGEDSERRVHTILALLQGLVRTVIWVVGGMAILAELGIEIAALLAAAGVVGLAVSFGAKDLVADIFAGTLLLLENQIREGDVVQINDIGGTVEELNLRTVRLRAADGTVYFFRNGSIQRLANVTFGFSRYIWDLRVDYGEDIDRVAALVMGLAARMRQESAFSAAILDDLEVLGVDRFTENGVVLKLAVKTLPGQHRTVGRELNRRIKIAFDEAGIRFPLPARRLWAGSARDHHTRPAGRRDL